MNILEIFLASLISSKGGDLTDFYSKSEVDQRIIEKISEIVADAPKDFDTLKELSDWITAHADSAATMNSMIASNTQALTNKVDKESGKVLSSNNFTNAYKSKLDRLENYDDTDIKEDIAKISEESVLNRNTLGYQRKNLLRNNCSDKTRNGVTATVNDDGSITLNGTNTATGTTGNNDIMYWNMQTGATGNTIAGQYANNKKWLPNGKYILSGLTAGAYLQMVFSEDNETESRYAGISNGETTFEVTDADKYVWTRLRIALGASFDNVTIYPMIRPIEVTDNSYEPYKSSVIEYMENNIVILDSEEEFNALTTKTADFYFIKEEEE